MDNLEKDFKNEINNLSKELDVISLDCIEIQRLLFEITFNHCLNNVLEQEVENHAKKESNKEVKE